MAKPPLPDLLPRGARLVFIGTAAGAHSAKVGAYYARPGNKFWPTLHRIGLTPERFAPEDFPKLASLGIGLTDLCKTKSGQDRDLTPTDYDIAGLRRKLRRVRPEAIAFTSKTGAAIYLGVTTGALRVGRQAGGDSPITFVLPSPSGQATSHWSIKPWRDLADWFRGAD